MATKRSKNGDDEKLDAGTLDRVISLLEPVEEGKQPITKKAACEILNIAYNTTRLGKLIEVHKDKKKRAAERRAALRGKPVSKEDACYIIGEYLKGESVSALSEMTSRSCGVINRVLEEYAVPLRAKAYDYFKPEMIPEGAMREKFLVGEIVYSPAYDSTAIVDKELKQNGSNVYRIWLLSEKQNQYAYQPAWELASLQHLQELGVKL